MKNLEYRTGSNAKNYDEPRNKEFDYSYLSMNQRKL
jgi:hypothetical protein